MSVRSRRIVALSAAAAGCVIEALEARRCLSVTLENGLLIYEGTAANDYLVITPNAYDATMLMVMDNGTDLTFKRADVTGAVLRGGDGHDWMGAQFGRKIDFPMTILGGAGDDTILGGSAADSLVGGEGEDFVDGRSFDGYGQEPRTDVEPVTDGHDTLVHADGPDTVVGEGGPDDFHGRDARLGSIYYHRGVCRISLPLEVGEFMLLKYATPVIDVNHGYSTCPYKPAAFEVYLSRATDRAQFAEVAAELGIPVSFHFYEDGETPGQPAPVDTTEPAVPPDDAKSESDVPHDADPASDVPAAPAVRAALSSGGSIFATTVRHAWDDAVEAA